MITDTSSARRQGRHDRKESTVFGWHRMECQRRKRAGRSVYPYVWQDRAEECACRSDGSDSGQVSRKSIEMME